MTMEETLRTRRASAPENCTCLHLRQASRVVTQVYDAALAPAGLKVTQFSLLAMAAGRGPMMVSALADALVMDRTTLTRNLGPLVARGLVRVESGDDRRERRVAITPAGAAALDAARPRWQAAQARLVRRLGSDAWNRLLDGLDRAVAGARPG